MTRKPRKILLGVLLLIVFSGVLIHMVYVDAVQRRQQALNDALLDAIPNDHVADVRELLRRGADPNCRQQPKSFQEKVENVAPRLWGLFHKGEAPDLYLTPLGLAVFNPQPEIVKALLDAGANPNKKDSYGQTPRDIDANGQDGIYWMLKAAEQNKKEPCRKRHGY